MSKRYDDRVVYRNKLPFYKKVLRDRDRVYIDQYATPELKHLTEEQTGQLSLEPVTWQFGERYFKLAHRYYGGSRYWWVIAHVNQKPTEFDIQVGETIYVPLPLDRVLAFLED